MTTNQQKEQLGSWFEQLQDEIIQELQAIEHMLSASSVLFEKKTWHRQAGGGGTMAVMRGGVFEKVGVNVSRVHGYFEPDFANKIPGAQANHTFWASGISFVAHPYNPFVPIAHMNTRHIETKISWFGGGSDLTPIFPFDEDTKLFHDCLKQACDNHDPNNYQIFKKWCDEYFHIPHRNESRGVGGIFFDDLNTGDFEKDFAFIKNVGQTFLKTYGDIVRKRMLTSFDEEHQKEQLFKRAKYAEFNLIYDRGTQFGLKTGGNIEAIFMSLPPLAAWT